MTSQERITVHNLAGKLQGLFWALKQHLSNRPHHLLDLKNTSDDAIPNYLNSLKFKQDHSLIDTRLALGYSAFAVAAACFLWDYKLGFESTKWYTAAAVALYSLINGALTIWISFVEKGTVYQGTAPDGTKVSRQQYHKNHIPFLHLFSMRRTYHIPSHPILPFSHWNGHGHN